MPHGTRSNIYQHNIYIIKYFANFSYKRFNIYILNLLHLPSRRIFNPFQSDENFKQKIFEIVVHADPPIVRSKFILKSLRDRFLHPRQLGRRGRFGVLHINLVYLRCSGSSWDLIPGQYGKGLQEDFSLEDCWTLVIPVVEESRFELCSYALIYALENHLQHYISLFFCLIAYIINMIFQ